MTQRDLFDHSEREPLARPVETPQEARDNAMRQVDMGAALEWKRAAAVALRAVARRQATLTSGDVVAHLAEHYPNVQTPEPRAMGPVVRRAQTEGLIAPTGQFVNSQNRHDHNRPMRVWRSLICQQQERTEDR